MAVAVVTGASRGIGLELARQLAGSETMSAVYATFRGDTCPAALQAVADAPGSRVRPLAMDVTDDASIAAAAAEVQREAGRVDWLVNNAGTAGRAHPDETFETATREELLAVFNVNAGGSLAATQAFLPLLRAALPARPKVCFMTSWMGSNANNSGGSPSYRASKAACNSLAATLAQDCDWLLSFALHPGWVQTDMGNAGGRQAPLAVDESARGCLRVLAEIEETGQFLQYDGAVVDW